MQRDQAAAMLGRLHRALLRYPAPVIPVLLGQATVTHLPRVDDLPEIIDPALDAWHSANCSNPEPYTLGPIHGDYYRRNLLVEDERIRGIIDWDDAHIDFLMQEIAWSAWEFCKTPIGDDWYPQRAKRFFQAYLAAGGPVNPAEGASAISFIRWRLREEIRLGLATADANQPHDREYTQSEIRAFQRLKNQEINF